MQNEAFYLVSCCGEHVGVPGSREIVLQEAGRLAEERFWDLWKNRTPTVLSESERDELDIKLFALVEEPLPLQEWLDKYNRVRSRDEAVEQLRSELREDEKHLTELTLKFGDDKVKEEKLRDGIRKVVQSRERLRVAMEGAKK